jgi:hypothetical protein
LGLLSVRRKGLDIDISFSYNHHCEKETAMAEIIVLPGAKPPASALAHFVRIGNSGHLQLEDLQAHGRFPAKRVVVDAPRLRYQARFLATLGKDGVEIVLDTKAAELAEPAKRFGYAQYAPWTPPDDRLLGPEYFEKGPKDIVGRIADVAIEANVNVVLAPTHFLRGGATDAWLNMDLETCARLRAELDARGGKHIAIDYSLITPHTLLRDEATRGAFAARLDNLPFEFLWIRASGFGADGTPAGARSYINALGGFHNLGRPVVADYVGGLIGLATLAFGAASGIAHGVGELERFDASGWHHPPVKDEGDDEGRRGGRINRVYVSALDRGLTAAELRALAKARGGRGLVVCQDRNCCNHLDHMIENWRAHFLTQRSKQINRLATVPDLKREEDFLCVDVAAADQAARQIKELNPVESELVPRKGETPAEAKANFVKRLNQQARREEKLRATLENLHETKPGGSPRVKSASSRIQSSSPNTKMKP